MLDERKIRQTADPVHLGFNEQRQPIIRGDSYHYLIARGDQLAFAAEVVRFGFSPSDFALEIKRVPNKASRHRAVRKPGQRDTARAGSKRAKDIVATLPAVGRTGLANCFPNTGDLFGTANDSDLRKLQDIVTQKLR